MFTRSKKRSEVDRSLGSSPPTSTPTLKKRRGESRPRETTPPCSSAPFTFVCPPAPVKSQSPPLLTSMIKQEEEEVSEGSFGTLHLSRPEWSPFTRAPRSSLDEGAGEHVSDRSFRSFSPFNPFKDVQMPVKQESDPLPWPCVPPAQDLQAGPLPYGGDASLHAHGDMPQEPSGGDTWDGLKALSSAYLSQLPALRIKSAEDALDSLDAAQALGLQSEWGAASGSPTAVEGVPSTGSPQMGLETGAQESFLPNAAPELDEAKPEPKPRLKCVIKFKINGIPAPAQTLPAATASQEVAPPASGWMPARNRAAQRAVAPRAVLASAPVQEFSGARATQASRGHVAAAATATAPGPASAGDPAPVAAQVAAMDAAAGANVPAGVRGTQPPVSKWNDRAESLVKTLREHGHEALFDYNEFLKLVRAVCNGGRLTKKTRDDINNIFDTLTKHPELTKESAKAYNGKTKDYKPGFQQRMVNPETCERNYREIRGPLDEKKMKKAVARFLHRDKNGQCCLAQAIQKEVEDKLMVRLKNAVSEQQRSS